MPFGLFLGCPICPGDEWCGSKFRGAGHPNGPAIFSKGVLTRGTIVLVSSKMTGRLKTRGCWSDSLSMRRAAVQRELGKSICRVQALTYETRREAWDSVIVFLES